MVMRGSRANPMSAIVTARRGGGADQVGVLRHVVHLVSYRVGEYIVRSQMPTWLTRKVVISDIMMAGCRSS